MQFEEVYPSLDNYLRAVILFGRNVASYKFALGKCLLELAQQGRTVIPLTELALPFGRHIAHHLKLADKQGTFSSSRFLDACRQFNRGELTEAQLQQATVRLGFNNVIDAFHVVGNKDIGVRFFEDERSTPMKSIRLTDEVLKLPELYQNRNLPSEIEARWRLVETAWQLDMPVNAMVVAYDPDLEWLVTDGRETRRTSITSCRDALNGYQKGKCFYCFGDISLVEGEPDLADVDHFLPHCLKGFRQDFRWVGQIDGVWNLVLACQTCNRGPAGKFDLVPELRFLERLHTRNEFLIGSHHPVRETLLLQTGTMAEQRVAFLNDAYRGAVQLLTQRWKPRHEHEPAF
jgi:hypothetical protein